MFNKDFFKNKDNIIAIIGIVFFIVLAIFARSNNGGTSTNKKEEDINVTEKEEQLEDVVEDRINYKFTYTVNNNGNISIIEGKRYNSKQKFSIIENGRKEEYAKLDTSYMRLFNNSYEILKDDINSYFRYVDIDNVNELIEYSSYEEDDDKEIYEIDVTDLIDKYNIELDYDGFYDFKNDSIIIVRDGKKIKRIDIDYSNYFTYINNSSYVFKVTMNFDSYGKVDDFDI